MTASKDTILSFLKKRPKAIFASSSKDGAPNAALMLYVVDDDFSLYFGTCQHFSKYKNLITNPHISFVIPDGSPDPLALVEGEGIAAELDAKEAKVIRERIINEHSSKFYIQDEPDLKMFKITPKKVHYIDGSSGSLDFTDVPL